MALWKEVWQFLSPPAFRWSEVYYRSQSGSQSLVLVPPDLIQARLNLLDGQNTFVRVRFSDVNVPRRATEQRINQKGVSDDANNQSPANAAEAAVIVLASTVTPARRNLWLRGMPEGSLFRTNDTGEDFILPGYEQQVNNFCLQLKTAQYLIAVTQKPGSGDIVTKQIVSVDGTAGNGTSVLTMSGGLGAAAGEWIVIRKPAYKTAPGLNGAFQILSSVVETFKYTIRYRTPEDRLLIGVPLGEAYKRQYLDTAVIDNTASGFSYIGARQTKNPNTGSRGARRAIRLRGLS